MAAPPPIPVNRYLTPNVTLTVPDGFAAIDQSMANGLPHRLDLDKDTKLLVIVPTGLVSVWRDADPAAVVTRSDEEQTSFAGQPGQPIADAARSPAQLVLLANGAILGAAPLGAGLQRLYPETGAGGVRIELLIRSWQICAGTLRGPGDFGSSISLAWRRADQAVENYSTPPPNPIILPRLKLIDRFESVVGLERFEQRLSRFDIKKAVIIR